MKNNICLFFLLLITVNTSCQKKWGINMQTKESSENYMLSELEKTYGVKFEIDNKRGGLSFWTQKVFGKETKCFDAAVKVLNGDEQKYIVSMDETGFFEDTIHLLKYHTLLLDNVNKILNFSETDIRVNIELVGLLREKKYASNFSYESYLKSHAFETWIRVFIPTENNNKECAKKIKKIMPNIYDKALSDFNITLAVYEGNSEDRLLFLFDMDQYNLKEEYWSEEEIYERLSFRR